MRNCIVILRASVTCGLLVVAGAAGAAETAKFLNAPASAARPVPKLAVQYGLKLHLPEGRGLARLLLDAGVNQDDAAAAAKLAAGHLGDGSGGCQATVSISRGADGAGFRLERVQLYTQAEQTVIEWRNGELAIASQSPSKYYPRLV